MNINKNKVLLCLIFISIVIAPVENSYASEEEIVVLLHGLARSDLSFKKMESSLQKEGYKTCNISYPSTKYPIEVLVSNYVLPDIKRCLGAKGLSVKFVTHSMGGYFSKIFSNANPYYYYSYKPQLLGGNQVSPTDYY